jgi:hypothetical protein
MLSALLQPQIARTQHAQRVVNNIFFFNIFTPRGTQDFFAEHGADHDKQTSRDVSCIISIAITLHLHLSHSDIKTSAVVYGFWKSRKVYTNSLLDYRDILSEIQLRNAALKVGLRGKQLFSFVKTSYSVF